MTSKTTPLISGILVIAALAGAGYQTYRLSRVTQEKAATESALTAAQQQIDALKKDASDLATTITKLTADKQTLDSLLTSAQKQTDAYKNQLNDVTNTVDQLTKLTQTDKELLQKYSRVYFLSENYVPSDLTNIDTKYLAVKNKPLQFHDRAWRFLRQMLDDASDTGIPLQVISAYRSFGTQEALKSNYKVIYGAGTSNQFSADQGYSEHQLGTAVDLTTPSLGTNFDQSFDKTTAYLWLQAHAYQYGFILSYPPNNTFYQFEPWHWRFVGIALATRLHNEGKNFYNLEQRDIDSYLINIFNAQLTSSTTATTTIGN